MNKIKIHLPLFLVLLFIFIIGTQAQLVTKEVNINVTETGGLSLFYVPIDRIDQFLNGNFDATLASTSLFLNKTYPIADDKLKIGKTNIPYIPSLTERIPYYGDPFFLTSIYRHAVLPGLALPNKVIGVVPSGWFALHLRSGTKGISVRGLPFTVIIEDDVKHAVTHEVGHTYGLCDEYDEAWRKQDKGKNLCPNGDVDDDGNLDPNCSKSECFNPPDCSLIFYPGCPASTLGVLIDRSEDESSLYNIMGGPEKPNDRWISKDSYKHLLKEFSKPHTEQYPSRVLVSGTIDKNGVVTLDDSYVLNEGFVTEQVDMPIGNFSVESLNDIGNVLHSLSFQPSFEVYEIGGGVVDVDTTAFAFVLPFTPETEKIVIEEESVVKAEQVRTDNAPVVDIVSPEGGEVFTGDFSISWIASDADSDSLSYAVLISNDNGNTWSTLVFDYDDTSYLVNVSYLDEGDKYLVKVLATDGINTGEDVSDSTFSIVHEEEVRRI